MRPLAITIILVLLALPESGYGQEPTDLLSYDRETCEVTAEALREGAVVSDRTEALWYLRRCGPDGASALASELARLRTTSDWERLLGAYHAISSVLDAGIFESALRLVEDRAASPESRAMAVRLLISYQGSDNVAPSFDSFFSGSSVQLSTESGAAKVEHVALPRDWESTTSDLLEGIAADSTENEAIRNAALWALGFF